MIKKYANIIGVTEETIGKKLIFLYNGQKQMLVQKKEQ